MSLIQVKRLCCIFTNARRFPRILFPKEYTVNGASLLYLSCGYDILYCEFNYHLVMTSRQLKIAFISMYVNSSFFMSGWYLSFAFELKFSSYDLRYTCTFGIHWTRSFVFSYFLVNDLIDFSSPRRIEKRAYAFIIFLK